MARLMSVPAIVLAVVVAGGTLAEPADPIAKVAHRQTEAMKKDLDLTAEQIPRVRQINEGEASDLQKLVSKYKSAGSDKKALVQEALAIGKARETQLQQVLTPEQWRTYQGSRPERTAERMTRLMTLQLSLSDDQIPRVEQINLVATRRIQAELGTDFKEKSKYRKSQIAGALRSIGEDRDHSLVKVLTGEQWGTYSQNQQEMREIMREKLLEGQSP